MGISDIGKQVSTHYMLRALRGDLNDTQRQISSGKKSADLGGLGALGASHAISFRNKTGTLDAYTENLKQAKVKFDVMDKAMLAVTDAARDTLATLRKQLQDTVPKAAILSGEARVQLTSVTDKLNAQIEGKYLFSGDAVYDKPFANPAALDSGMSALIAGWLAGAPTSASVAANARGVTGTGLGISASTIASGEASFRADDETDIVYSVKPDLAGFADVLRGLSIVANLPQPTNAVEQENYWTVVNGVIALLDAGTKTIDEYQGLLGNKATQVDRLLSQHEDTKVTYETYLGEVEDADIAAATTRFQGLQSQMEMSYNLIAQLKNLSLINYL